MLAEYLAAFAQAARAQPERVYLDAFAGEGTGLDRVTGEEFRGSARIALEAGGGKGFTRFRYFEKGQRGKGALESLRADYPDKDIKVYEGDCNARIPEVLDELKALNWAPTFAFLDPDGMELAWSTLEALAEHKRGYRSPSSTKPEFKVELWVLFATPGVMRTLALDDAKVSEADFARADRLFGTDEWRPIYELRKQRAIEAGEAREEYLNLMRWRIERALGYRFAHPFELKNTKGVPIYHMIFATDNDAGTRIMSQIYSNAAERLPAMLEEARNRAVGQQAFDLGDSHLALEIGYRYEPPWEPRG